MWFRTPQDQLLLHNNLHSISEENRVLRLKKCFHCISMDMRNQERPIFVNDSILYKLRQLQCCKSSSSKTVPYLHCCFPLKRWTLARIFCHDTRALVQVSLLKIKMTLTFLNPVHWSHLSFQIFLAYCSAGLNTAKENQMVPHLLWEKRFLCLWRVQNFLGQGELEEQLLLSLDLRSIWVPRPQW